MSIAYQVVGDGPIDLVYVSGFASNLLWNWQLPSYARFLTMLASFSRLIVVDRRGTGLSDRFSPADLPPLGTLAEDLTVILEDVGCDEAAFFGCEDGGHSCAPFAATHPERTRALVLYSVNPGGYEGGWTLETWDEYIAAAWRNWGTRSFALEDLRGAAPSYVGDQRVGDWHVACLQLGASPAAAEALQWIWRDTDIRALLPSIRLRPGRVPGRTVRPGRDQRPSWRRSRPSRVGVEVGSMNGGIALEGSRGDLLNVLGTVEQAMSVDFVLLSPETHVGEAIVLMEGALAGTGVVVEAGRLVGVVTPSDLLDVRTLACRAGTLWGPGHSHAGWRVVDVMTPCRRAVSSVEPLSRAVEAMYEDDLERVPVENDERQLAGILSRRDVMRAVARR